MFNLKILGISVLILGLMAGGFYWYYTDSQSRIATLVANNAVLNSAVEQQTATITSLQTDYDLANAERQRLDTELSASRSQNRLLVDRLAKHELGALARSKPGLVENRVNQASELAGRCFELLTGAELNDKERNATNGRQFNSECPWLFDTLRITP